MTVVLKSCGRSSYDFKALWAVLGRSQGLFWWSWAALRAYVGGLGPLSGRMWEDWGRSWESCGRSWVTPGASVGGLGPLLGPLWEVLDRSWDLCGRSWAALGLPVGDLEVLLAPLNSLRRSSFQRTSVFPRSAYFSSGSAISSPLALA